VLVLGANSQSFVSLSGIFFVVPSAEPQAPEAVQAAPITGRINSTALTLLGGWRADSRFQAPVAHRVGRLCLLSGVAAPSSSGASFTTTVARAPAGCRPLLREQFALFNQRTFAISWRATRYDVLPSGDVRYVAGEFGGELLSFDGLIYPVADSMAPIQLQGMFVNAEGHTAPAQYLRDGDLCVLSGVVRPDSNDVSDFTNQFARLPAECRPVGGRLVFTASHNDRSLRVDITIEGEVVLSGGDVTYPFLSLSGIAFTTTTTRALTLAGQWSPFRSNFRDPAITVQNDLCIVSGMVNNPGGQQTVAHLPSECLPLNALVFAVNSQSEALRFDVSASGVISWQAGQRVHSWASLDGIRFVRRIEA
jgi:outer membrane murein-binding lipoprotein Lpp